MRCVLLLLLTLVTGCATPASEVRAPGPARQQLSAVISRHLAALHARDLDALLPTVTEADSLVLILPSGRTTFGRDEYVAFHRAWFSDRSWRMTFQPLSTTVRDGLGIALFRTSYVDASGERAGLVSLAFALERGEWRLIHDQNTALPGP